MCGFVGFSDLKRNLSENMSIIKNMNSKLQKRGPDEEGYFLNKNINLGHRRLIIVDAEDGKQPMSIRHNEVTYTIVCNGQLYNKNEIKKELQEIGCKFKRIFRYRNSIKSVYSLWLKSIAQIKWHF